MRIFNEYWYNRYETWGSLTLIIIFSSFIYLWWIGIFVKNKSIDPQMYQSVMKLHIQEMNNNVYLLSIHFIWLIMISILLAYKREGEGKKEINWYCIFYLESSQFSSNSLLYSILRFFIKSIVSSFNFMIICWFKMIF